MNGLCNVVFLEKSTFPVGNRLLTLELLPNRCATVILLGIFIVGV